MSPVMHRYSQRDCWQRWCIPLRGFIGFIHPRWLAEFWSTAVTPQNKQHRSNKTKLKSYIISTTIYTSFCMPKRNYQTATCTELFWEKPPMYLDAGMKKKCPKSNFAWSTCATCVATRRKHVWALKGQRPPAVMENSKVTIGECDQGGTAQELLEKKWLTSWNPENCNEGHIIFCLHFEYIYVYVARFGTSTYHFRVWLE